MRLIDADALLQSTDKESVHAWEIALAPTVDAVEVVRCKDCMYRYGNVCDYSAVYVRPHGYCQWGRRKEDETD